MSESEKTSPVREKNPGWIVTFAGMGINLALGILYTWSVISKGIPSEWGWSEADRSWPYSVACLVFSLVMVPAGRMQDHMGPRMVATIGGVFVGAGMILCGFTTSLFGYILGFGVLVGAGMGFGYASATPPAVKWFPAKNTGMIAGIVVSGFGLASVYAAPLTNWLLLTYGIKTTVLSLGLLFLVIITTLAQLLKAPHKVMQFVNKLGPKEIYQEVKPVNYGPGEMLGTVQFYLLWFMFACGAGAGLMVIAKLAKIAKAQAGLELGFLLVAALAVGNGAGRVVAGMLSDKIGRKMTLFSCFVFQAILIIILSRATTGTFLATTLVMALISALIGANYGANLALFPSITKDFYGLKNFGINYGLVFTAWGMGGFMLAMIAGKLYDQTQSFNVAYYGASVLLVAAALLSLLLRHPARRSG